jgi:dethiobiotin synthetase
MPQSYFVTGTDTDVGKTVVSAWLTLHLKGHYWKPIQTGSATGDTDSTTVAQIVGEDHVLPSAYVYQAPLAPLHAAEAEGAQVNPTALTLPPSDRPLVVEGAGGVMVPITSDYLMLDLIEQLRLPTIITARTTLGTLNHTLLTIAALRDRQLPIKGIVFSGPLIQANFQAIEVLGKVKILGHIPPLKSVTKTSLEQVQPWLPL